MLRVQFVEDVPGSASDEVVEIMMLKEVNHPLPPVGAKVKTYDPAAIFAIDSYDEWSLSENYLFVRCHLRRVVGKHL
jgi:hypothetical protein